MNGVFSCPSFLDTIVALLCNFKYIHLMPVPNCDRNKIGAPFNINQYCNSKLLARFKEPPRNPAHISSHFMQAMSYGMCHHMRQSHVALFLVRTVELFHICHGVVHLSISGDE